MNHRFFELFVYAPNLVFYCMEMKFIITRKLEMSVGGGDIGPVETELIFSAFTVTFGLLGPEFYQDKLIN